MKKFYYIILAIIIVILGSVMYYFRTISFEDLLSDVFSPDDEIVEMMITHTIIGDYAEEKGLDEQHRKIIITDPAIIENILSESAEMEIRAGKSKLIEYIITLTSANGEKTVIFMGDDNIIHLSKNYKIKSDNKLIEVINKQELEWDILYYK